MLHLGYCNVAGYSDSDWTGNLLNSTSASEVVFTLGDGPTAWRRLSGACTRRSGKTTM